MKDELQVLYEVDKESPSEKVEARLVRAFGVIFDELERDFETEIKNENTNQKLQKVKS